MTFRAWIQGLRGSNGREDAAAMSQSVKDAIVAANETVRMVNAMIAKLDAGEPLREADTPYADRHIRS